MSPERLYQQLEDVLARLGIPVRCERFDPRLFGELSSKGGLCRVHGRRVVLVDSRAPLVDRIAVLATAAASLDSESVFVMPAVRAVIHAHGMRPAAPNRRPPLLRLVAADDEGGPHR